MLIHKIKLRVILMSAFTFVMVFALTSKLSAGIADSVVFQNDSVFTIEGVQEELKTDGEWIKVTKAEIDPGGVTDESGGFDEEINTDYVWRPTNVEEGWSPYTNGYWVYTNCSWMWVSYYTWGWRTHHYGRWWYSDVWGWVWSPGFVWAPAWVVWMYNDGYCGWYPISPWVRCYNNYNYRCHTMRYKVRCWTFVEKRKFADPITPRIAIVDPKNNPRIVTTCTFDGDPKISVSGVNTNGPKVSIIEEVTGKKIAVNDVEKYNNTGKYKDSDPKKKKNDLNTDTWKVKDGGNNTKSTKTDGNNSEGNNNTGTKKNDGNNNSGNNNTGEKKKDGNSNKDWNTGNKDNGKKQYTPPPKQDPPKQYDPPKQEQPKQDPPKKYDPPKQEQPKKESTPPTKQDDGSKSKQ
jgi:hypothetical protein